MRASGELVHVECEPGKVIAVPAWMLDPVTCSRMQLGEPRVCASALLASREFLSTLGFGASSRRGISAAKEDTNEPRDSPDNAQTAGDVSLWRVEQSWTVSGSELRDTS